VVTHKCAAAVQYNGIKVRLLLLPRAPDSSPQSRHPAVRCPLSAVPAELLFFSHSLLPFLVPSQSQVIPVRNYPFVIRATVRDHQSHKNHTRKRYTTVTKLPKLTNCHPYITVCRVCLNYYHCIQYHSPHLTQQTLLITHRNQPYQPHQSYHPQQPTATHPTTSTGYSRNRSSRNRAGINRE
jgi:hypothetical protein